MSTGRQFVNFGNAVFETIGIKIGDSLDTLRTAKRELQQAAIGITGMSGHTVSHNLSLSDSDGTEVELHVDADEELRKLGYRVGSSEHKMWYSAPWTRITRRRWPNSR